MRQLLPQPAEVDVADCYSTDLRPGPEGRPWVLANMIESIDGAATLEGTSAGLGGPGDRRAFAAIRAVADVILVAAGTARAESYNAPQTSPDQQQRRRNREQDPFPRLCVLTARLDLDPEAPLFHPGDDRPPALVATIAGADPGRRTALSTVAEVLVVGDGRVDLSELLSLLGAMGTDVVLCEGGPSLIGQLVALDLVDELCVSVSPLVVGSDSRRIATGPPGLPSRAMTLQRILEADGMLLLRYVRDRSRP